MKKYYLKPTMKFHELNTSRSLLEGSGQLQSNQAYQTQSVSWGNEIEYEENN